MAGEMSNVVFLNVDGEEAEEAAEKYNISAQALLTFVFLKNGQKIADLLWLNGSMKPIHDSWLTN